MPVPKPTDKVKKIVDDLISNCDGCGWEEDHREMLSGLKEETLMALNAQRQQLVANQAVVNAVSGVTGEKDVGKLPEMVKNLGRRGDPPPDAKPTANLSDEDKEDLAFARRMKAELKQKAVATITSNKANKFTQEQLDGMPLETLENMALLVNQEEEEGDEPTRATVNYLGSAIAPGQRSSEDDRKAILPSVPIDWSKAAKSA